MSRGGTGGEADGLLLGDEFTRSEANTTLLVGRAEFASLERGVVAQGLVEQRFDQGCAAVCAENKTALFEPGKIADLMVADGDPLEITTRVEQVFIAGKLMPAENRQTRLFEKYDHRPRGPKARPR